MKRNREKHLSNDKARKFEKFTFWVIKYALELPFYSYEYIDKNTQFSFSN